MKDIKIANYSIYITGDTSPYTMGIEKQYKGVIVKCDNDPDDSRYMNLRIRNKKTKFTIWKRSCERMDSLTFDDRSYSITCDFDNEPKNKSLKTLFFEPEVYDELKENLPVFLKECESKHEAVPGKESLVLIF